MVFIERNLVALICLGILALVVVAFKLWARWLVTPQLDEPISIVARATIDRTIDLPVKDRYFLSLVFDREGKPSDELSKLIGHSGMELIGAPPGVVIPISWELSNVDTSAIVASGNADTKGSNSWSNTEVGRLLQAVEAPSGRYRFRAQILRDVPEFAGVNAKIRLELIPKLAESWQMAVWWWGQLLSIFVALPAAIVLLAWVVYRGLTQGRTDGP